MNKDIVRNDNDFTVQLGADDFAEDEYLQVDEDSGNIMVFSETSDTDGDHEVEDGDDIMSYTNTRNNNHLTQE